MLGKTLYVRFHEDWSGLIMDRLTKVFHMAVFEVEFDAGINVDLYLFGVGVSVRIACSGK